MTSGQDNTLIVEPVAESENIKFENELEWLGAKFRELSQSPNTPYRYAIGILYPLVRDGPPLQISPASYTSPRYRYNDPALRLTRHILDNKNLVGLPVLHRHNTDERVGTIIYTQAVGTKLYGVLRFNKSDPIAWRYHRDIHTRAAGCSIKYLPIIENGKMVDANVIEVSLTHIPVYTDAKLLIAASNDQPEIDKCMAE